jgi:ABC-type polysaccharide/polyol phosphate export permease
MQSVYRHRGLIVNFVRRDLQARYKGSTMGVFWSIVQPLVMLILYTMVFSTILKVQVGPAEGTGVFAIYLFCGMLPWNAFQEGISRSAGVILDHSNLIKRTIFPAEILPIYVVASGLVQELIGLGILLGAVLLTAKTLSPTLFFLPVILLLQGFLTLGLAWIVAAVNVFLRDVGQLLGLVLTFWLFLTPIFYPPSLVPGSLAWILLVNPMVWVVEAYRSVILRGAIPSSTSLLALALCSSAAFLIGHRLFQRMQGAFADVI